MSAIKLSSFLAQFGDLMPSSVERWIAASLGQAAALREHDAWLFPADPSRLLVAERLHGAWRDWSDDAEAILQKASSLKASGHQIAGFEQLRDAVGRAGAMLDLAPATIATRSAKAKKGDVVSIGEVRRELHYFTSGGPCPTS